MCQPNCIISKSKTLIIIFSLSSFHHHISLQESLTKMGVGAKDDIENWFTGEKLGLSG